MRTLGIALALLSAAPAAHAQQGHDPAARIAAQRTAMAKLAALDGEWRGPAWTLQPGGRIEVVQTERVGPFLDGSIRLVEGRGYLPDGSIGFNALAVISYDPAADRYSMQSYAMGHSGTFPLTPTADGFVWEIPAGPNAKIRYTATVKDGKWHEIGERLVEGREPLRIYEMELTRIGDTSWPLETPVGRE